jgi:SAM-dependent methyltransferase
MLETITFKGKTYPKFQSEGNAARFVIPFAKEVCKGYGFDVGCNRHEWSLPGSIPVDPAMNDKYDAYNLPTEWHFYNDWFGAKKDYVHVTEFDYVFSSHCLEHLPDWVEALDYWHTRLKSGGVVFLYLPDHSQVYWRPYHNRKHIHSFTPQIVGSYFTDQPDKWTNVFISGVDLNNSFTIIAEKV